MSVKRGVKRHGGASLGYALRRAQHIFRRELDRELTSLGVTAPQYSVLSSLDIEPGLSNAALARAALVTPQSMLGIVALLEKQGLIIRSPIESHGRVLEARLTRKGRDVLVRAHRVVRTAERRMAAGLSKAETDNLRTLLERLCGNADID